MCCKPGCTAAKGFSLVELMMVLVMVSILLAVALPGYQHVVVKSARAAARHTLMDVMARQEQFFVNNKRYAISLAELGLPEAYFIDSQGEVVPRPAARYRVVLELLEDSFDGIRATPLNSQSRDLDCLSFALSRQGVRSVSGSLAATPARCW